MKIDTLIVLLVVVGVVLMILGLAIEYNPTPSKIGYGIAFVGILYVASAGLTAVIDLFERRFGHGY